MKSHDNIADVSVVIPTYNSARTIHNTLTSVFNQSVTPKEIIVVDDGSRDETLTELKPFSEKIILISQKNSGAAAARNNGVKAASGKYIAFLDSDDIWQSQKIEMQLKIFKENPDIALCYTDLISTPEDNPSFDFFSEYHAASVPKYEKIDDFDRVFFNPFFGTPSVMLLRDIFFECGGFDENLATAEDVDLWLRVSYKRIIAKINEPLVIVIKRKDSLSSRNNDNIFHDHLKVVETFCTKNPEFFSASQPTIRRTKAKIYENWGSSSLFSKQDSLAIKLLANSLSFHFTFRASYLFLKAITRKLNPLTQ